jgi:hypothetical protein
MSLSMWSWSRRAAASIKKEVDAVNGGGKVEVQHLDLASLKWVALSRLAPSFALTWPASELMMYFAHQLEQISPEAE